MRKLDIHKVEGRNSMRSWHRIKNPLLMAFNFVIIYGCRFIPSLTIKSALYRIVGIKVGKDVSVGLMAMFDIIFPELIEIGDNSVIGYNSIILAHEYLVDEWRTGRVKIGKNVMIGANTTVLAGVTIGDDAVVSAASLINRDVPPGAFVGGVPAREIEEGDR
jgi:acetyltransferase-like isoleucine patch superfamily enzyme